MSTAHATALAESALPGQVQPTIEHLRGCLATVSREDVLLDRIRLDLAALRELFKAKPADFSPEDVSFLKSVAGIGTHLQEFVELQEEMLDIRSLEEGRQLLHRLSELRVALSSFPVANRIAKEIRELRERLPRIRQREQHRQQSQMQSRILDLEEHGPNCAEGHKMVIRQGPMDGFFWGCSGYPHCSLTARLTEMQRAQLLLPAA